MPIKDPVGIRVFISNALRTRFKAACARQGVSMSEQATLLIEEWVQEFETKDSDLPVQALLRATLAEEGREWSKAKTERERVEMFAEFCGLTALDVFGILAGDRPNHKQIICLAMAIMKDGESIDSTELAALVKQQYGKQNGNKKQKQANGV